MTEDSEMKKKVLIIAYYWPPSGGSGVQRWLKFVKYLPQFGWEPHVFTPENPSFSVLDESLNKDVPPEAVIVRFPIWEPYDAFFKLASVFGEKKSATPTGLVTVKKPSLFQRLSTWVRGNVFIPDPRIFWVKPSVRFLQKYLQEQGIDIIVTTGPPHSMHLIGYALKGLMPSLKWIADFRDPWSEWGFLDSLNVGLRARKIHKKLELNVLKRADQVITITPFYVRQFEALSGRPVSLLTNGYDDADFTNLNIVRTPKFVIRHVGIVNEKCDPRPFMHAVRELAGENAEFKAAVQVDFVGEVHRDFKAFVEASAEMSSFTTFTPPVPHKQLISLYGHSSLLLLVLTGYKDAAGYMPGKLFEYLATGLPITGTGPAEGDASNLLRSAGLNSLIEGTEKELIKKDVVTHFNAWNSARVPRGQKAGINYSRKEITRVLTKLLER